MGIILVFLYEIRGFMYLKTPFRTRPNLQRELKMPFWPVCYTGNTQDMMTKTVLIRSMILKND